LMSRVEGDREFLRELLTVFRQDSARNVEKAKEELKSANMEALSRTAHKLKGMLGSLCMAQSAEIARELEAGAAAGNTEECGELLGKLERGLRELLPEVEAQLAEVKT